MKSNNNLYLLAAEAIQEVYKGIGENSGSTEWNLKTTTLEGEPVQILAIAGTNDLVDWLWNLALVSWNGVKFGSYLSAKRICKRVKINPNMPLVVAGHSKSGPTAFYYKYKYGADYCVTFCPARGLRKKIKLDSTTMFIDPDDIVPKLGALSFNHPICKKITLPKDHKWISIKNHFMSHVINYLKHVDD